MQINGSTSIDDKEKKNYADVRCINLQNPNDLDLIIVLFLFIQQYASLYYICYFIESNTATLPPPQNPTLHQTPHIYTKTHYRDIITNEMSNVFIMPLFIL